MKLTATKLGINFTLAVLLVVFGFGVSDTYQKYKGSELSRFPQSPLHVSSSQPATVIDRSQPMAYVSLATPESRQASTKTEGEPSSTHRPAV